MLGGESLVRLAEHPAGAAIARREKLAPALARIAARETRRHAGRRSLAEGAARRGRHPALAGGRRRLTWSKPSAPPASRSRRSRAGISAAGSTPRRRKGRPPTSTCCCPKRGSARRWPRSPPPASATCRRARASSAICERRATRPRSRSRPANWSSFTSGSGAARPPGLAAPEPEVEARPVGRPVARGRQQPSRKPGAGAQPARRCRKPAAASATSRSAPAARSKSASSGAASGRPDRRAVPAAPGFDQVAGGRRPWSGGAAPSTELGGRADVSRACRASRLLAAGDHADVGRTGHRPAIRRETRFIGVLLWDWCFIRCGNAVSNRARAQADQLRKLLLLRRSAPRPGHLCHSTGGITGIADEVGGARGGDPGRCRAASRTTPLDRLQSKDPPARPGRGGPCLKRKMCTTPTSSPAAAASRAGPGPAPSCTTRSRFRSGRARRAAGHQLDLVRRRRCDRQVGGSRSGGDAAPTLRRPARVLGEDVQAAARKARCGSAAPRRDRRQLVPLEASAGRRHSSSSSRRARSAPPARRRRPDRLTRPRAVPGQARRQVATAIGRQAKAHRGPAARELCTKKLHFRQAAHDVPWAGRRARTGAGRFPARRRCPGPLAARSIKQPNGGAPRGPRHPDLRDRRQQSLGEEADLDLAHARPAGPGSPSSAAGSPSSTRTSAARKTALLGGQQPTPTPYGASRAGALLGRGQPPRP